MQCSAVGRGCCKDLLPEALLHDSLLLQPVGDPLVPPNLVITCWGLGRTAKGVFKVGLGTSKGCVKKLQFFLHCAHTDGDI